MQKTQAQIKWPRCLVLAFCFPFWECSKVDYQPIRPDEMRIKVNHLGMYSSRLGEDDELQGTQFQTTWTLQITKGKTTGIGSLVHRHYDTLQGKGFHKNSMPGELEKKVDLDLELGSDGIPVKITGYDSLHRILGRILQPAAFSKQLIAQSDTVYFQAWLRDLYRMERFLPSGLLINGTALEVGKINEHLETIKLDSARYRSTTPRLKRVCLDFDAYYHRMDSLPLLVEQFFGSSAKNRKWKRSEWSPGKVEGIWHFSMDKKSGISCMESLVETGFITLKKIKEKKEKPEEKPQEQPIRLIRYEEDIFEF